MNTVVVRAASPETLDEVRTELVSAFQVVQNAIAGNSAIVVVVPTEDLLGHTSPERAAYVNALVGMTRAIAFEGVRAAWTINTVAVPSTRQLSDADAIAAVATEGLSGQVLTLGSTLVGKLIP